MTRFFVSEGGLGLNRAVLTGENLAHAKVLRLKAGEKLLLCDGAGRESLATVREVGANEILLDLEPPVPSASEAAVRVSVYMAFSKGDKLEHVIQKATELGAYEIVAFPSARCVSRPDEKSLKKKLERWQKIAASAAEQSGRGRIPEVVAGGAGGSGGPAGGLCRLYPGQAHSALRDCPAVRPVRRHVRRRRVLIFSENAPPMPFFGIGGVCFLL